MPYSNLWNRLLKAGLVNDPSNVQPRTPLTPSEHCGVSTEWLVAFKNTLTVQPSQAPVNRANALAQMARQQPGPPLSSASGAEMHDAESTTTASEASLILEGLDTAGLVTALVVPLTTAAAAASLAVSSASAAFGTSSGIRRVLPCVIAASDTASRQCLF